MIRLNRNPKPIELTDELKNSLTAEFIATKKSVWNKAFIKSGLLALSNGKCAYCECILNEESKYLEVEHYFPKDLYQDKVIDWENLLPACKRCNTNKGAHDTGVNPIVNPCNEDPREHLAFRDYQIRKKTSKGGETIDVLNLNETDKLVRVRFEIGQAIHAQLSSLNQVSVEYSNSQSTKSKNTLIGNLKELLREATPPSEYAATAATVLIKDEEFTQIVSRMKTHGLWDLEHENLHSQATDIAFERY